MFGALEKQKKTNQKKMTDYIHQDQECIHITKITPSWKIGTSERSNIKNQIYVPGVGQYNLDKNSSNGPKYTIRPKTKELTNSTICPGPGNYNPNFNIEHKSSERYTLRPKTGEVKSNKIVPGPGQYTIRNDKSDMKQPSYIFGKDKKNQLENNTSKLTPGPGNYNIDSYNSSLAQPPKYTFGKEDRAAQNSSMNSRAKTPGPGQYKTEGVLGQNAPKISMSFCKPSSNNKNTTPGPGNYSISDDLTTNKAPQVKFGKSQRGFLNKESIKVPGPGNYDQNNNILKQHAPTWKFGSSTRGNFQSTSNKVPGPGNYNILNKTGSEAPKYSLTARNYYGGGSANKAYVPGPGQYTNESNNTTNFKSPTWKIGSSTREDSLNKIKKEAIPGPGNYSNISEEKGPKYSFGKEQRVKSATSETPGPGNYKVPTSIFNVPTFTQGAWDKNYKFV